MAPKLIPSSGAGATWTELQSLEQQAMHGIIEVAIRENIYNTANPDNLQNRATIAVNYDNRTVTAQLTLGLTDTAMNGQLVSGCLPYLP